MMPKFTLPSGQMPNNYHRPSTTHDYDLTFKQTALEHGLHAFFFVSLRTAQPVRSMQHAHVCMRSIK